MPAAAVIPAPVAYIKFVAVKKLVVEALWGGRGGSGRLTFPTSARTAAVALSCCCRDLALYLEQIRVFQAGSRLNSPAWNNTIGLCPICWCYGVR